MEPKDRIIVALDVDEPSRALEIVETLSEHVGAFKIGLEFINATFVRLISHEWEKAHALHKELRRLFRIIGDKLFWDGKLMDIPNTIAGASRPMTNLGVKMFNVHCLGGTKMMRAAVEAANSVKCVSPNGGRPVVLGVTLLTSLSYEDLVELELTPVLPHAGDDEKRRRISGKVVHLAGLAKACGLDGVICSPHEIAAVRAFCGPDFKIVTPGVRPTWADTNDQRRVMTPGEAVTTGADALVIGRPITQDKDPVDAAKRIADEIGYALAKKEV